MAGGRDDGVKQGATEKTKKTLKLTELESGYVALAQKEHNRLVKKANAPIARANPLQAQAMATFRRAVEGSFKEQQHSIPTAEVRIKNDEAGLPSELAWEESE